MTTHFIETWYKIDNEAGNWYFVIGKGYEMNVYHIF